MADKFWASVSSRSAWLCGAVFLFCVLLIWPTVESGINDDWSLARTAEVFAHTGRIAYNGWEAPMLLWQTVTSGLLMRIFGFSYLVVRLNTAVHGLVAVVLLQRCCVRSGLSEKLATFVTLVFALCPVFLGCAVMGMTDVVGLLALITCYYGCLRAVQASTDRASALWLCFAVVSDLVLSTTRQLDFIGVVVLVPCTLYILRRKRSLVLFGAGLLVLGAIFIALVLHWFNRQPYIPSQSILPEHFSRQMLPRAFFVVAYAILDSGILIFPACLLLLPAWKKVNARTLTYVAGIFLLFTIAHLIYYRNPEHEVRLLAPFFLITFYDQAVENTFNSMILPPKGTPPVGLSLGAKILLTSLSLVAATSFLSAWFLRKELPPHEESVRLTWKRLLILTVPLLVSLLLLLLPRGVQMVPPDRYLLSFFPFALILLARYRSRRFGQGIPRLAVAALAAMALYSVATIHDLFAVFRANLAVIQELEASGVPRENIDGGWEYNYETQVLHFGHTEAAGITRPGNVVFYPDTSVEQGPCGAYHPLETPVVHAQYAISWPDTPCPAVNAFAPVAYHTWLPPFRRELHVIEAQPNQWIPAKPRHGGNYVPRH